jgi:hypothetical protein
MGKQTRRLSRRTRSGRTVPMTPEVEKAIEDQMQFFRDKFGREPGPDDPLFFDPDADIPQLMTDEKIRKGIIDAMVAAGLDPSFIYAYQKTGLLPTEDNWDSLSPKDQAEWRAAIAEWGSLGKQ